MAFLNLISSVIHFDNVTIEQNLKTTKNWKTELATDSEYFKLWSTGEPFVSFGHYPLFHDMILDIKFTPGQRLEIPEHIITAWNEDGAFIIR